MKQKTSISIKDLCVKLDRDIPTILNLAKSGKIPLWALFEGVHCYEEQLDGSMLAVKLAHRLTVRPMPEVLDIFFKIESTQSDLSTIHEKDALELVYSELSQATDPEIKGNFQPNKQYPVNLNTVPLLVIDESGNNNELLFYAFPALTEKGTPLILKQIVHPISTTESDGPGNAKKKGSTYHAHTPVTLKIADLFAYEDDADKYLKDLTEAYCIGQKKLMGHIGYKKGKIGCDSFTTVKKWVKNAGFDFDRLIEGDGDSRPMLKYSVIDKVNEYIKSKKDKKKI